MEGRWRSCAADARVNIRGQWLVVSDQHSHPNVAKDAPLGWGTRLRGKQISFDFAQDRLSSLPHPRTPTPGVLRAPDALLGMTSAGGGVQLRRERPHPSLAKNVRWGWGTRFRFCRTGVSDPQKQSPHPNVAKSAPLGWGTLSALCRTRVSDPQKQNPHPVLAKNAR